MTDRKDPTLIDDGLDRLLGELKPPKPSDLLRARVENAVVGAPAASPAPGQAAGPTWAPRRAFYSRIAASLALAAGVALATWLPAPVPDGAAPVAAPLAAGPVVGNGAEAYAREENARDRAQDGARDASRETAIGLALVGGGAPVIGIALVRAEPDGAESGIGTGGRTGNGFGSAPAFDLTVGLETVGFETDAEAIDSGLDSIPLY